MDTIERIVAPATDEFLRNTEASIVELSDGSLLLAYTEFYGGSEDDCSARIVALTSHDRGESWTDKRILKDNDAQQNVMSVSLLRLKDGSIGFIYLSKNSSQDCRVCFRKSFDEARTWAEEKLISTGGYSVVNNDRLVQLSNGTLIVPIALKDPTRLRDHYISFCSLSFDSGETWEYSLPRIDLPLRRAMEPGVVELQNGRLMMIIRT